MSSSFVRTDRVPALIGMATQLSRDELDIEVEAFAQVLRESSLTRLATLMDNSIAWVVADLAAAAAGIVHVPLPLFFTPAQIQHALTIAGVDAVLVPPTVAERWPNVTHATCRIAGESLALIRLPPGPRPVVPAGTSKITFTSGTTAAPKGVCLSGAAIDGIAHGLREAMRPLDIRRHLCALPFAVLLENIAGLAAPLSNEAACIVLPLADVGLRGSSQFDAAQFHRAVMQYEPHSVIVLPQMLRAWVAYLSQSAGRAPDGLRLVAVGGASVGAKLLAEAHRVGIPAYEGYGLTEACSVQTLNLPSANRPGSAGKPLPHARVRVAHDGEIEVSGSLMSGYLGEPPLTSGWWPTGDIGRLDADGFVYIDGRRKHVLITSFGRNISPEWVETTLRSEPAIAEAVAFGDGQPNLSAVLWPARADIDDPALQQAVDAANASLPDYARIDSWCRATQDFTARDGMATPNGKPRRDTIYERHAVELNAGTTTTRPTP